MSRVISIIERINRTKSIGDPERLIQEIAEASAADFKGENSGGARRSQLIEDQHDTLGSSPAAGDQALSNAVVPIGQRIRNLRDRVKTLQTILAAKMQAAINNRDYSQINDAGAVGSLSNDLEKVIVNYDAGIKQFQPLLTTAREIIGRLQTALASPMADNAASDMSDAIEQLSGLIGELESGNRDGTSIAATVESRRNERMRQGENHLRGRFGSVAPTLAAAGRTVSGKDLVESIVESQRERTPTELLEQSLKRHAATLSEGKIPQRI